MKFKSSAQRKAVMSKLSIRDAFHKAGKGWFIYPVTARQFFIARFQRTPEEDKQYYGEWEHRFKTGYPENYMDSISQSVYRNLQKGNQVKAIQTKTGKWQVIKIPYKRY
jgi:hypothetical protein